MKYDEYRRNGWFIGSGVIESGCKTVIGQRFKQSGMIWSLKGAKALLPLRTLHKSNRLEEFSNISSKTSDRSIARHETGCHLIDSA